MLPTITAFRNSPDRGRGLARDLRVRWALEEVGQPYRVQLLDFAELKAPTHRAIQPFGQIPTYEDGELALFESGAIVLHLAERHGVLLPQDPGARIRAIGWMFAALNTVEPSVSNFRWPPSWTAASHGSPTAWPRWRRRHGAGWATSRGAWETHPGWTADSAPATC